MAADPGPPEAWRLTIREDGVSLHAGNVLAVRGPGVADTFTLREMHRALERLRDTAGGDRKTWPEAERLLRRLGRALAAAISPDAAGRLAEAVARAGRSGRRLTLGLDIETGVLASLPWEAMLLPGTDSPLAIHDAVLPYRGANAIRPPAGPGRATLRVVALLASPQSRFGRSSAALLDLESETRRLVSAASSSDGSLDLRVLSTGSLDALAEAVETDPADVVHIVCHAEPGRLLLEDAAGERRPVSARDLAAAWRKAPPTVVVLAGCSTGAQIRSAPAPAGGARYLSGLAQDLADLDVTAVIAMTAPVRDVYAGHLMAAVYSRLGADGDLPAALHTARADRERVRRQDRDWLPEWHVPVLFAGSPRARSSHPRPAAPAAVPDAPLALPLGAFVGRRALLRAAVRALTEHAGLIVHGVGGGGKSAFLGEVLRARAADGPVAVLAGPVDPDGIMDKVAAVLAETPQAPVPVALVDPDRDWRDRLTALSELRASGEERPPITLVLDDFEVNLDDRQGYTAFKDRELAAFLTSWLQDVRHAALLATSRHPLPLGHEGSGRLTQLALPPLTAAETDLLRLRLPALHRLPQRVWREVHEVIGGHPRTYDYLDALLRTQQIPAGDVARRLERLVEGGLEAAWARTGGILRPALDEAVQATVRDTLFGELLAALEESGRRLLTRAAVFRLPVPTEAFASDGGGTRESIRRLEHLGLIAPVAEESGGVHWIVHRWTVDMLARLEPRAVKEAHGRAARFWQDRFLRTDVPRAQRVMAAQEAIHHFLEVGDPAQAAAQGRQLCGVLHSAGHWSAEQVLCERMLAWVAPGSEHEAQIHRQLGLIARDRGEAAQALAHLARAESVSRAAGDQLGIAFAAHQTGSVHHNIGRFAEAEAGYRTAAEIFEALGRERDLAASMYEISMLEEDRGHLEAARSGLQAAMETFERVGDQEALIACHRRLAALAERTGDLETAMAHCRHAMAMCENTGDWAAATSIRNQIGTLHVLAGDDEAAYHEFDTALREAQNRGMSEEIARSRQHLGVTAQRMGALDIAEEHVRAALELNLELGRVTDQAGCWGLLASIAERQGKPLLGLSRARHALMAFLRTDDIRGRAHTYLAAGNCLLALGRRGAARSFYEKGIAEAAEAQDTFVVLQIREKLEAMPPER